MAAATISTAREGLPAADGETLPKSAELDIFVRDRAPSARFLGTAYVLPAGGEPTIPIVTVNTTKVNAKLFRIGDRQLADAISGGSFLSQLSSWETDDIEAKTGEKVWEGSVDVASDINQRDHDRHPGRRAAVEAEARRLHPDRRGGEQRRGMDAEGDAMVHRHRPRADDALRQ